MSWLGGGRERGKWGEEEKEAVTGKGAGDGRALAAAAGRRSEQLAGGPHPWVWAQEGGKTDQWVSLACSGGLGGRSPRMHPPQSHASPSAPALWGGGPGRGAFCVTLAFFLF